MADDEMLTVEEVARRMKVKPETVRRWLRSHALRGIRMNTGIGGGGYRIQRAEFERFLESRRPD